jgi:threonine synthase
VIAAGPTAFTHLECARAGHRHPPLPWRGLCDCGSPLAARYDLEAIAERLPREALAPRGRSLWRYRELLPLPRDAPIADLGEGGTPLLRSPRIAEELGVAAAWVKDEAGNPTGSFKARGLSLAVHMAAALGRDRLALPSAGNAATALAAYARALGVTARVFLPCETPAAFVTWCRVFGAEVTLVDGTIADAGRAMRDTLGPEWTDLSTLREPYRLEGKKTLGYEIAEALGWTLPDVIVYPTGGGTGLLGLWKAFEEMEALGWIERGQRPRLVSVQAEGCAPIVRAFAHGDETATPWENAHTAASGLRVPQAIADFWILRALRESGGTAIAVGEEELLADTVALARATGVVAAPEGGAVLAATRLLAASGWLRATDRVVLFNTGSGLSYREATESALALTARAPQSGGAAPPPPAP